VKLVRSAVVVGALVLLVAAPLATSAAASSSGVQSTTGSISGTVTGFGGAPVGGACVSLTGESGPPMLVSSDGSGHYSFSGLQPDQFSNLDLSVSADCSTSDPRANDYLVYFASVSMPVAADVTVNAALTLGGSISGSVFDAAHHPISNVCVTASNPEGLNHGFGQSGPDGSFTLAGVVPDTYTVTLDGCDGSAQTPPTENLQPQLYDNTQQGSAAVPVTVHLGSTTALNPQTMLEGGELDLKLNLPPGVSPDDVSVVATPVNPPADFFEDGIVAGPSSQGVWTIENLLAIPYLISYNYCPSGGFCRTGVGFYKGQGINNPTPTDVVPTPGSPKSLTDTLAIPPYTESTTTVQVSPGPIVAGSTVTLTAKVTPTSGSRIPTGTVYFSDLPTGVGVLPIIGLATVDASGFATLSATDVTAGVHSIFASYNGDGGTDSSTSTSLTFTVVPAPAGGSSGSGGPGGSGGGGGSASAPVTVTVPAGGSASSDPVGTAPTSSNPLVVGVTSPTGGAITIDKTPPNTSIGHYKVLGVGATITAPAATSADPLQLSFDVFDGTLPSGGHASDLTVFRDGVAVAACTGAGATPDPCVASAVTSGGVTSLVVRSSHASTWDVEAAQVGRAAGTDRIATAVAVSQDSYPAGNAGAVVLARADDYPDALVGGPLAAAKNAPLLLTEGPTLPTATQAEISRVLPVGGTVYLLGGAAAIPAAVASELTTEGYVVMRYAGADRYATAVAVADALGDPSTVLLATGSNFPDALAAGPAAAHVHGVVLLTSGTTLPTATSAYLAKATTTYAIGGPAATADPSASAIVGTDRFATAADVAARFFTSPTSAGVATGESFPDALSGGAQLARAGVPLLLCSTDSMPSATSAYLSGAGASIKGIQLYGGSAAISSAVQSQLATSLPS
jgi:putative cell wall-binding protein